MIVVIIFGVASHSREFHGLTPASDGSTAVKTHNNHYESWAIAAATTLRLEVRRLDDGCLSASRRGSRDSDAFETVDERVPLFEAVQLDRRVAVVHAAPLAELD